VTSDGSGLDAFELLVWATLIPLFVVLVGRALNRKNDDEAAPPGDGEKGDPSDDSKEAKRE